jgi:hypothetical protein
MEAGRLKAKVVIVGMPFDRYYRRQRRLVFLGLYIEDGKGFMAGGPF